MKCAWLENMLSIETDGWTRPCCLETNRGARISNITDGINVAFFHPKLLKLKENLSTGYSAETRPFCKRCEDVEIKGQPSLRQLTDVVSETRELKVIQFKMSNKCQLTCAHCGPERSSGWAKLLNIKPHVQNSFEVTEGFIEELKELLPQLTTLKFTGGEPFLDPNHWKILEALKSCDRSSCELEYITNGLIVPRYDLWDGWKNIKCSISVDGFEETYEWFRRGASWSELISCVDILAKHSEVSINYAMTPYTVSDYHKSKDFWKYPHSAFPIVYPSHVNLLNFPKRAVQQVPGYSTIPFYDLCSDAGSVMPFKLWAQEWDKTWNTPGWADRLFPWFENAI